MEKRSGGMLVGQEETGGWLGLLKLKLAAQIGLAAFLFNAHRNPQRPSHATCGKHPPSDFIRCLTGIGIRAALLHLGQLFVADRGEGGSVTV